MMHYFNRDRQILVVGDVSGQACALVKRLRELGVQCAIGKTAAEAFILLELALLNGVTPGLIIVESALPEGSGQDFIRHVRNNVKLENVPIIIASIAEGRTGGMVYAQPALLTQTSANSNCDHNENEDEKMIEGRQFDIKEPHGELDILVAEDNDINQQVISEFLQTTGYQFTVVENGRRAVSAFSKFKPRLILMDVSMPELNGREATAAIRAMESTGTRRVPIVALTAHALAGDREACLESGMDEYITKPINFAELREIIDIHIGTPVSAKSAA